MSLSILSQSLNCEKPLMSPPYITRKTGRKPASYFCFSNFLICRAILWQIASFGSLFSESTWILSFIKAIFCSFVIPSPTLIFNWKLVFTYSSNLRGCIPNNASHAIPFFTIPHIVTYTSFDWSCLWTIEFPSKLPLSKWQMKLAIYRLSFKSLHAKAANV